MNTEANVGNEDPSLPTRQHIARVQELLKVITDNLTQRGVVHDASKLREPEVELFNKASSVLKGLTYGSAEYKRTLKEVLGPAIEHHYQCNTHHPEHWDYKDRRGEWHQIGIRRMSLLDQLEMLADWRAAGERHADGSMVKSLEHNRVRFKIPADQFWQLCRTTMELGWITWEECLDLTNWCYPQP